MLPIALLVVDTYIRAFFALLSVTIYLPALQLPKCHCISSTADSFPIAFNSVILVECWNLVKILFCCLATVSSFSSLCRKLFLHLTAVPFSGLALWELRCLMLSEQKDQTHTEQVDHVYCAWSGSNCIFSPALWKVVSSVAVNLMIRRENGSYLNTSRVTFLNDHFEVSRIHSLAVDAELTWSSLLGLLNMGLDLL